MLTEVPPALAAQARLQGDCAPFQGYHRQDDDAKRLRRVTDGALLHITGGLFPPVPDGSEILNDPSVSGG